MSVGHKSKQSNGDAGKVDASESKPHHYKKCSTGEECRQLNGNMGDEAFRAFLG